MASRHTESSSNIEFWYGPFTRPLEWEERHTIGSMSARVQHKTEEIDEHLTLSPASRKNSRDESIQPFERRLMNYRPTSSVESTLQPPQSKNRREILRSQPPLSLLRPGDRSQDVRLFPSETPGEQQDIDTRDTKAYAEPASDIVPHSPSNLERQVLSPTQLHPIRETDEHESCSSPRDEGLIQAEHNDAHEGALVNTMKHEHDMDDFSKDVMAQGQRVYQEHNKDGYQNTYDNASKSFPRSAYVKDWLYKQGDVEANHSTENANENMEEPEAYSEYENTKEIKDRDDNHIQPHYNADTGIWDVGNPAVRFQEPKEEEKTEDKIWSYVRNQDDISSSYDTSYLERTEIEVAEAEQGSPDRHAVAHEGSHIPTSGLPIQSPSISNGRKPSELYENPFLGALDLTLFLGEDTEAEHLIYSMAPPAVEDKVPMSILVQIKSLFWKRQIVNACDVEKEAVSGVSTSLAIGGSRDSLKNDLLDCEFRNRLRRLANLERLDAKMLEALLACVIPFIKGSSRSSSKETVSQNPMTTSQFTVGEILNHVYEQGVLSRPNIHRKDLIRGNTVTLKATLEACNIWTRSTDSIRLSRTRLEDKKYLNWTLSKLLTTSSVKRPHLTVERRNRSHSSRSDSSKHNTFTADNLNIDTLMQLGELRIEWTCIAEDHLKLVMGGSRYDDASSASAFSGDDDDDDPKARNTLYLYWFDAIEMSWLAAYFYEDCDEDEAILMSLEIRRTWSFLFHPREKSRYKAAQKAYRSLKVPGWVKRYLDTTASHSKVKMRSLETLGDVIAAKLDKNIHDMQQHMNPNLRKYNMSKDGQYSYRLFQRYRTRIVLLQRYMDGRKPNGWRQLWLQDSRSAAWFMFWSVLVFGILSLLLATLSLIANTIQAWASVKALHSN